MILLTHQGSDATADMGGLADRSGTESPLREGPGSRIGVYKLIQLIGEGGFGFVFMAQQEQPVQRVVALKIIKLGMDTRQVVARFEQERQALAMMDHPNIARVLDAGATDTGRPYFVMEMVKGEPIAGYCDKNNLTIEQRLELFAQVCTAVQHAHTKGIIHRDIKPSNILVSLQDGRPSAKVIDFGIAKATSSKLTERTLFTEHRQLIGTPEYMSPEQAEGSLDIDTRTDVYSLGVLLYELLTGTTPFSGKELRSAAYGEIQRIIREVEPPVPSTRLSRNSETIAGIAAKRRTEPRKLGSTIRGELDWIVMKALEKDRQRRYETANGLGMDIQRYLLGEAVLAAPPSTSYRLRKLVQRNKVAVLAGSAVAASLLAGLVTAAWQASIARGQRDRAVAAEGQTKQRAEELQQVSDFQATMLSQIDATQAGEDLVADIRERFDKALVKMEVGTEQRATRAAVLAGELAEVNATDAAAAMIDRTILLPSIKAIDEKFKGQPSVDATLRHTLAELYQNLGQYGEAERQQVLALETRRRVLGEMHADTMMSINNMASILEQQGRESEAEVLYREAVEKRKKVLGMDHHDTLSSMGNLGNLLRDQRKFDEAEPLLRQSLDGMRRVMGPAHRDTLIAMNTYGFLLIDTGKVKEAEPYWREAYEIGSREFGADDRDVLVWTNNMGGLLGSLGRHGESEPYYRKAMEGTRRVHGLEHPNSIGCVMSYGNVLVSLGRFGDAEAYFREALAVRERTLGKDHRDTLESMWKLGNALRAQVKYAEAEVYLRESLEGKRRTLGMEHPSTLVGVGALARLCVDQGKVAEGESLYRESLEVSTRVVGKENPNRLVDLVNLGSLLMKEGRMEEAAPLIVECLEIRERVFGPDHPETLIALSNMARLLELQMKTVEAEAMFRDVLSRFRRLQGDNHPNTLNAYTNLANVLMVNGKLDESESLCREAVTRMERELGKERARTATARISLGRVLIAQARYAEAETEMVEAERVMGIANGVTASQHAKCMEDLAKLYEAWEKAQAGGGHATKAEGWRAAAVAKGGAKVEMKVEPKVETKVETKPLQSK